MGGREGGREDTYTQKRVPMRRYAFSSTHTGLCAPVMCFRASRAHACYTEQEYQIQPLISLDVPFGQLTVTICMTVMNDSELVSISRRCELHVSRLYAGGTSALSLILYYRAITRDARISRGKQPISVYFVATYLKRGLQ